MKSEESALCFFHKALAPEESLPVRIFLLRNKQGLPTGSVMFRFACASCAEKTEERAQELGYAVIRTEIKSG